MAWALVEPLGFGRYFPNGDFVGWREKLKKCPHLDEHYRGSTVAFKFTSAEEPLMDCEIPEEFRMEKSCKDLADMIIINSGLLAITEPLKNIIEALEPGVHQFFPLKMTMPRGKVYPEPYFGMIILRKLDSFVPEKSSDFHTFTSYTGEKYYHFDETKKSISRLALSGEKIKGTHLWREKYVQTPNIFMSDELRNAIKEAGLTIFRHHPVKVV